MKKCIVLDLDNTLWGGVIGEDGIDGIKLSTASPGASFVAFQQALLDLHHRGIILAINSYNNYEDAISVIRSHPNMILKENHFAAIRINWTDKVENLRDLARELNIGLDSMVFLDDSPMNRESVKAFLPEVEVPQLPTDPSLYTKFLLSLNYFDSNVITDEDKMRGNLYVTERLRKEAEKSFTNKEDFLRDLSLEVCVYRNDSSQTARLAQLTEKTNQFNVQKRPMNADEINFYIKDPGFEVYHARVSDRFGDYGITAHALVRRDGKEWHIQTFLLSCRVIGRGIEDALLYSISRHAAESGASILTINMKPNEKNGPAQEFVRRFFVQPRLPIESITMPKWITIYYDKN